jgi:hypothetical protein
MAPPAPASQWNDDNARLFALLDTATNRGASLPGLAAARDAEMQREALAPDHELQRQHTRAEIEHLQKGQDPAILALQQARVAAEMAGINARGEHYQNLTTSEQQKIDQKKREFEFENDPTADAAKSLRRSFIALGADPTVVDGLTAKQMMTGRDTFFAPTVSKRKVAEAIAIAKGEVAPHVDTAVQISHGKLGDELQLAQARGDIQAKNATAKGAAKSDTADEQVAAQSRQYPMFPSVEPSLEKAHLNGRQRGKYDTDMQNAAALYHASRDLKKVHADMLAGPRRGEGPGEFAARIDSGYTFARKKAALFMTQLGGNSSDAAMEQNLQLFPGTLNVENEARLNAIMPLLDHIIEAKVGVHGRTVEGSDRAKAYAEQQAAKADEPERVDNPTEEAAEPTPAAAPAPRAVSPRHAPADEATHAYRASRAGHVIEAYPMTPAQAADARAKGWKLE